MSDRILIVAAARGQTDTLPRLLAAAEHLSGSGDIHTFGEWPPEDAAPLIADLATGCRAVLAADDDFGRDAVARASALAGAPFLGGVIAFPTPVAAVRPQFADSVHATVELPHGAFVTVRTTAFEPFVGFIDPKLHLHLQSPRSGSRRRDLATAPGGGPNLASAPVVVGAGRGAATPARMEIVRRIAARLGAAIGATRPLIDEALAPPEALLGQSGKVVAPRLYIALGISGALQHLAGVKDAAVIAAINTDADAPMIEAADLVWIADLDTALPELEAALADGGRR